MWEGRGGEEGGVGVGGEGEGGGGRRRCRRKEECKVALSQQSTSKQSGTLKTSMEACFSFLFHNSAAKDDSGWYAKRLCG